MDRGSRLSIVLILALVCGVAGCADEQTEPRGFAVRDSAGVRIVENLMPVAEMSDTCRVSLAPALDLGLAEGDPAYELYRAFDGTRLPDGRIVVVLEGAQEVRVFDGDGSFLYAFGRDGDGPGEFRKPYEVWRIRGDSLVVFDSGPQRFSWFDDKGKFSHASALQPVYMNAPWVLDVADHLVVADHFFEPVQQGFKPQTLFVIRHSLEGATIDTMGAYPYGSLGQTGDPDLQFVSGPIFQPKSEVAATRSTLFVGRGEQPEIERRSITGDLLELWRWVGDSREVTDEHLALREKEIRDRFADSPRPELAEAILDKSIPVQDRFPALSELYVDASNNLWVRHYRRPGWQGPDRWLVFDPEGRFTCHGSTPKDMRLFEIGDDYILGMERDEIDVEHVTLYELRRPPAQSAGNE